MRYEGKLRDLDVVVSELAGEKSGVGIRNLGSHLAVPCCGDLQRSKV